MEFNKIYQGDVIDILKTFPDLCVDCVITSPPYWRLRDYQIFGQIGLEATLNEYVTKIVDVFREVRRVLKDEGICWLNLGDSYNGSGGAGGDYQEGGVKEGQPRYPIKNCPSLKQKDLCGIPWRVAFALQADGWWLRQDIIWEKPNPMPESVTDRCTKAHEYVFLLTKKAKYYFDNEAIKEPHKRDFSNEGGGWRNGEYTPKEHTAWKNDPMCKRGANQRFFYNSTGRNKRSVWTVTTKPFSEAHFATFPEDLVLPMILAGTSEKGVCPHCGKVWKRIIEKKAGTMNIRVRDAKKGILQQKSGFDEKASDSEIANYCKEIVGYTKTIGWQPSCQCGIEPVPSLVLDPFIGSGTVGLVALKHHRRFIGIDLNPSYIEIAMNRLRPWLAQNRLDQYK